MRTLSFGFLVMKRPMGININVIVVLERMELSSAETIAIA